MSLTKIQNALNVPKGQKNSYGKYNYRSNEDIQEAIKPILEKFGATLFVSYEIKEICGKPYSEATAVLYIDDAEYMVKAQAGIEKNGGMSEPQAYGSAHSYASKYACASLFLIDDVKDADATNKHEKTPKSASKTPVDYVRALRAQCEDNKLKFEEVYEWAKAKENPKDIKTTANAKHMLSSWDTVFPLINAYLAERIK